MEEWKDCLRLRLIGGMRSDEEAELHKRFVPNEDVGNEMKSKLKDVNSKNSLCDIVVLLAKDKILLSI